MDLRKKHLEAREERKSLKQEIKEIKRKRKKWKKELRKKEDNLKELTQNIRNWKSKLRVRATKKKGPKGGSKALVISGEKRLSKRSTDPKTLVPVPPKSLQKLDKHDAVPAKTTPARQNLKEIKGITETMEQLLNEAGIMNFAQLARCSSETLEGILKSKLDNLPELIALTWPEQALLADAGKFEELKKLQEKLDGLF